eukprot:4568974-Prymnesium_polylepis.1
MARPNLIRRPPTPPTASTHSSYGVHPLLLRRPPTPNMASTHPYHRQHGRCAVLSFHKGSPEQVGARSPLVEMLLKYGKERNGAYRTPLVQAASE